MTQFTTPLNIARTIHNRIAKIYKETPVIRKIVPKSKRISTDFLEWYDEIVPPEPAEQLNYEEEVKNLYALNFKTQKLVIPMLSFGLWTNNENLRSWNAKGFNLLSKMSTMVAYKLANRLDQVCLLKWSGTFGPATEGVTDQKGIFGLSAGSTRATYNDPGDSVSNAGDAYAVDGTNVLKDFMTAIEEWIGDGYPQPRTVTMVVDPLTYTWLGSLQKTYGAFTGLQKLKEYANSMGITIRGPYTSKHAHTSAATINTSVDSDRLSTSASDGSGCIAYIHDQVADLELVTSLPLQIETRFDKNARRWIVLGMTRTALKIVNGQGICIFDDIDIK